MVVLLNVYLIPIKGANVPSLFPINRFILPSTEYEAESIDLDLEYTVI